MVVRADLWNSDSVYPACAVCNIFAPGLNFARGFDLTTLTNHLNISLNRQDSVFCFLLYLSFSFSLNCICNKWNLFSVNIKVLTYLRSPNWDTRIAAGQAVEAIVKNIPEWDPTPKPKEGELLGVFIKTLILFNVSGVKLRHVCHTKHCICISFCVNNL